MAHHGELDAIRFRHRLLLAIDLGAAGGMSVDGAYAESLHLLIPEAVITVAALLGAVIEMRRRALDAATG